MSDEIKILIKKMSSLPGLGPTSARRLVLHLLSNRQKVMVPIVDLMRELSISVIECSKCKNIDVISPCHICSDERRDRGILCIVEGISDIWAFERGRIYNGLYHVLGGLLSAYSGMTPDKLGVDAIVSRVCAGDFSEVIIATSSSMQGQITAGYIAKELQKNAKLKVTRLACGMPVGGEVDYMDDGTLKAAISMRQDIFPKESTSH